MTDEEKAREFEEEVQKWLTTIQSWSGCVQQGEVFADIVRQAREDGARAEREACVSECREEKEYSDRNNMKQRAMGAAICEGRIRSRGDAPAKRDSGGYLKCGKVCDHDSPCTLPADHDPGDRHETEHGCTFYDVRRIDAQLSDDLVYRRYKNTFKPSGACSKEGCQVGWGEGRDLNVVTERAVQQERDAIRQLMLDKAYELRAFPRARAMLEELAEQVAIRGKKTT